MANIKFSQFTQKTTLGTVDFLVGYTGAQNIQIDPVDLLSGYSQGTGAAGQVTFFSAASTVTGDNNLYWDNTNKRLGVGTTSPDRKFEVASTGTGEMCITGATGSRLYFRPTTSYSPGGNFGILVTGSGGPSYLSTMTITGYNNGLNTVMTLKGDGNVGIGTATPVAKLQVEGSFISSGISQLGTTGADVLLTSSSAGNVGIGDSGPTAKLVVNNVGTKMLELKRSGNIKFRVLADANHGQLNMFNSGTSNTVRLHTSGDSYFNGGNVGIGTSSPTAKLHVQSSDNAATANLVYLENIGSGGSEGVSIKFNPMFNAESMIASNREGAVANACNLTFHTYNNTINEAMRITSAGNVGIGTTSPNANLEIDGGSSNAFIQFTTPNTNYAGIRFGDPQSINAGRIQYYHGAGALEFDTEVRFVFQGGNVGIGTDNPTQTLDVDGAIITEDYRSAGTFFLTSGDDWRFRSDTGSERMRINSAGNVGIGTDSPIRKLHLHKGDSSLNYIQITNSTTGAGGGDGVSFGITSDEVAIWNNRENTATTISTNNTERIRITNTGNVGIGTTTPDTVLEVVNDVDNSTNTATDVNAGILIHNGDSSGTAVLKLRGSGGDSGAVVFGGGIGAASDKFHIISRHNQTKRFTVQANGNVGVGASSPTSKLTVAVGDIETSGVGYGLILKSPNGTRYRVTVDNSGNLSTTAV